ncbi:MAG TPA: hypothetical protein VMG82_33780 [Candidatus Sulfotelmatobacter sp.]|nr:hypothetical protein [Candidatus Sulfotelmatobacter sp.]
MPHSYAYLSQGQLHLKLGNDPVRPIDSKFGESVRERAAQIHNRNSWKTQGTGAKFMSGGLLWGRNKADDPTDIPIDITGISRGCRPGELFYSLSTPDIGGVFLLRDRATDELRLLHTADFRVRRLAAGPAQDSVACVVQRKGGQSCLAVMRADGTDMRDITTGDTIDDAPHWAPGSARELVFQSSAIGRNRAGFAVTQAPFAIHKLNLEAGSIITLAEDSKFDLLMPQLSTDGSLFYIRRPYRDPSQPPSPWRAALDLGLLPYRLLYAVFQFLNFFTVRYTGNTLTTTGSARQKHADIRKMMIWGNLLDADKAADRAEDGTPALVPKSWELVRRSGTREEVVAKGVLCYDLYQDGSVLYSNGNGIYRLDQKGSAERLARDALIEQVVAVEE